ncbi:unnamed protein product, partial [marine sediment metagenome]
MRSDVVESGRVKPSVRDALESTFMHGNPWGRVREKRSDWLGDLQITVLKEGDKTELLTFICCTAAYDPRVQELSRSMVTVLQKTGIDFSILGNEESCCTNEMNELGEKGLFEMAQEKNKESFGKFSFPMMI